LLDHREQIDSIMLSIKPSLMGMLFKRFTAVMIKEYIKCLRQAEATKTKEEEKKEQKEEPRAVTP
jgi:predicted glycosyl hydrolase (DUF1957 family)